MNAVSEIEPKPGLRYALFHKSYKHKIRPPKQLERMRAAFRMDAEFFEQFMIFQKVLKQSRLDWGAEIMENLRHKGALPGSICDDETRQIQQLYDKHIRLFRVGRFDERYLDSIEDVALFFVCHDVKTIWIAGAYRELTGLLIDQVMDEVGKSAITPLAHSMKALNLALAIELNQIQRVFTMYEREVSESLVKDLTYGGMLTGMPKPKTKLM